MNIRLIAYSARGAEMALTLARGLDHSCRVWAPEKYSREGIEPLTGSAGSWAAEGFREADALIFCCAAGIAVRAIAPSVRSKTTDPAVIVVDECGRFSIPILSGHLGGANGLALEIAELLDAQPVVTTATDLHGLFAVDVFARQNHLALSSMTLAKEISAALLAGEKVGFSSDFPVSGTQPRELGQEGELGISVSADPASHPFERTLRLIPRRYAVGLGCRRDTPADQMEAFFTRQLEEAGITPEQLRCLASIDVKKDEQCLLALSKKYHLPFRSYTAEELNALPGSFSGSEFVRKTVGVDCVCERAAVKACAGTLVVRKIAANGMTFALAACEEDIRFE